MRKITTGQFNDSLYPIMDGVGLVAKNYAYWLNEKYGKGYCIGPKVPGFVDQEDYIRRFPTIPLPGHAPYRYGVPFIGKFRKDLRTIPFDIVHTHCPFVSAKEALRIAKERDIPLVTTFHSKYREDFVRSFHSQKLADKAVKTIMRFYAQADVVWVPNEPTIEVLRSYGHTGRIEVAINGTDLIAPQKNELEEYRKKGYEISGIEPDSFVMLFVGQHRWEKNVKLIIEGLSRIQKMGKPFQAVFIGSGPEANEMKQLVNRLGLSREVSFKGIIKEREVLKSYYAICDLFLFPSLYDTASLVMREAAAFNVPSILVRGSSTSKGVTDTENGFLIENTDEDFAAKIASLMDDPQAITTAGLGARKSIYLPWEKVVDQVYERYLAIIDEHSRS